MKRKLQTGCACKYREFVCISVLLWNLSVCYVTWTYKQLWKIVLHSLLAGGSGCHIYGLLSDFRNFQISTVFPVGCSNGSLLFCKKSEDRDSDAVHSGRCNCGYLYFSPSLFFLPAAYAFLMTFSTEKALGGYIREHMKNSGLETMWFMEL
ncbi:MAG: hypothetical protein ACLR2E_12935 [Lachnospiraceae bacterium]